MASMTTSSLIPSLSLRLLLGLLLLLVPALLLVLIVSLFVLLPAYTICLALITIVRANNFTPSQLSGKTENSSGTNRNNDAPWSNISTSIFQGRVFHVRQRPKIHSFQYPLSFAVVDLDEACDLFGNHAVAVDYSSGGENDNNEELVSESETRDRIGTLWPLSTLMLLQDKDHLKNGEGLPTSPSIASQTITTTKLSMKERVINLLYERTNGKLNLKQQLSSRKILLVTHLKYFYYCFNPVSFFFIFNQQQDEIEAVVVEVSNTPWNEMSIYVLHPDSVDTTMSQVYPSNSTTSLAKDGNMMSKTYHYQCVKKFHVSPFMTMDHDYDWKFQLNDDRIVVQAQMYKHADNEGSDEEEEEEEKKGNGFNDDDSETKKNGGNNSILYFTAGFDIQRTINATTQSYPLQLSKIILRYPIYCFVIQIWIHYEALRLLLKGIQFIPHPEGSETAASKMIAVVMRPVFAVMDMIDDLYVRLKGVGRGGGEKTTKLD